MCPESDGRPGGVGSNLRAAAPTRAAAGLEARAPDQRGGFENSFHRPVPYDGSTILSRVKLDRRLVPLRVLCVLRGFFRSYLRFLRGRLFNSSLERSLACTFRTVQAAFDFEVLGFDPPAPRRRGCDCLALEVAGSGLAFPVG